MVTQDLIMEVYGRSGSYSSFQERQQRRSFGHYSIRFSGFHQKPYDSFRQRQLRGPRVFHPQRKHLRHRGFR